MEHFSKYYNSYLQDDCPLFHKPSFSNFQREGQQFLYILSVETRLLKFEYYITRQAILTEWSFLILCFKHYNGVHDYGKCDKINIPVSVTLHI